MILTITVPDDIAPTVIDNICVATNYDAGSGKTKAAWVKEKVIAQIKSLNQAGAMKVVAIAQQASTATIS